MTATDYLKIPKERVGVLIGKNGETKKRIEELTQLELEIDSEAGSIVINSYDELEDPLMPWKTKSLITAIGRGFNPEIAMKLLDDDIVLEVIKLTEYVGKSKKALSRYKGRIIGREGITRQIILEMTGVDMSVYGKTVSLIGDLETMLIAKEAVEMILHGARHKSVYAFLERKKQDLKMKQFQESITLKR